MQFCAKARRKVFNEMTTHVKYKREVKRVRLVETRLVDFLLKRPDEGAFPSDPSFSKRISWESRH